MSSEANNESALLLVIIGFHYNYPIHSLIILSGLIDIYEEYAHVGKYYGINTLFMV